MNWKKTLLICILILAVAVAVIVLIFSTEPTAKKGGATQKTAMLVDVIPVERDTFQPVIVATGVVEAAQDIRLSARVSGEILQLSPAFTPGGFVRKGQMLLQIDPADYESTLKLRESDLKLAQADLDMEMGRQDVALQDYRLLGDTFSQMNKSLVLREPQLASVQAEVDAARAAVEQAELELQRTTIRAPFDAHIISRNANVGSQVAPGEVLGRLVAMDEYWVMVTVPVSKLAWLTFPKNGRNQGSTVKIRHRTAWPEGTYRTGYLYRMIGALEDQTRMARVLVTVPDPLAYHNETADAPALMIGSFVETRIQAKPLPDVIRLSRDYMRQKGTVWVMEDGKLRIRDVDIVFEDAQYAYIRSGLEAGEQVVTTNLSTVVDGSPLRTEDADTTSTGSQTKEDE